jgi:hypothetical protein
MGFLKALATNEWFLSLLASGLCAILVRVMKDDQLHAYGAQMKGALDAAGTRLGKIISTRGRGLIGPRAYEKIEAEAQRWGLSFFHGLMPEGKVPFGPAFMAALDVDDDQKGEPK